MAEAAPEPCGTPDSSAAQAANRAYLAAIVASSDDAILAKSLDGIITSWNAAAERLFGYAAGEAIGRPVTLIIPDRLAAEEEEILARIRARTRVPHFETVRRRRSGEECAVSVAVSPILDDAGDVIGAASVIRDITEAKRIEAELRRSNAELEQFAYVASHDLQEPLRMVANYTELLSQRYRGRLDERADRFIHFAVDGARRMQRLVADLLIYSRIGTEARPFEPVDMNQLLARVLRSLGPALEESGGTVGAAPLPGVMGDETQLGQLLLNLIGNALKFRGTAPPRVTIGASRQTSAYHFQIADNGIGMDMAHTERIFQMFPQLNDCERYKGSGIGLAVVKRIVERHGGRIWVESAPGHGSTFHFLLPAAEPGPQ